MQCLRSRGGAMSDVMASLTDFVQSWCKYQDDKRRQEELVRQNESSIRWYEKELATKRLTPAQRGNYRHEIRRLEIEIAFKGEDYEEIQTPDS